MLIGIAVKGKSVAGVIYQPFYNYKAGPEAKLGRCIWGIIGLGASLSSLLQSALSSTGVHAFQHDWPKVITV